MIGIVIVLRRFFASRLKSREQLEAENVALRQQLTVLHHATDRDPGSARVSDHATRFRSRLGYV